MYVNIYISVLSSALYTVVLFFLLLQFERLRTEDVVVQTVKPTEPNWLWFDLLNSNDMLLICICRMHFRNLFTLAKYILL